ncbi:MAG TPA: hypothetical protein VLZ05_01050 [Mycobacterium sp.]|nr:hypothetical protein [Mycobacterium sp.]HUH67579.1 hypothetical protein [Mycobacterium sp.]
MLAELVPILRGFAGLDVDDDTATLLIDMPAATIDRRLAPKRRKHQLKGPLAHQPGTPLKSRIPTQHLGGLRRRATGIRRDRSGLPRRRQRRR